MTALPLEQDTIQSEPLGLLRDAIAACAALDAAERLGVLQRLHRGPADARGLAAECSIDERGAQMLLSALSVLGLVQAVGEGAYQAAVPDIAPLMAMRSYWSRLAEVIRDGRPLVAGDTPAGAESLYPDTVPVLGMLFAPAAKRAAELLGSPGLRVLDVGAGAAPWSLAIAARYGSCSVTALDLPGLVPVTRRAVASAGCEGQFRYLEGDMFTTDLASSAYDLAIAGNLCHLFDERTNLRLLGRMFQALRPGGKLAVVDALPDDDLNGPRPVVLYALGLLLRTGQGRVYPFSMYEGWMRKAGYRSVERYDLTPSASLSLVTALRP